MSASITATKSPCARSRPAYMAASFPKFREKGQITHTRILLCIPAKQGGAFRHGNRHLQREIQTKGRLPSLSSALPLDESPQKNMAAPPPHYSRERLWKSVWSLRPPSSLFQISPVYYSVPAAKCHPRMFFFPSPRLFKKGTAAGKPFCRHFWTEEKSPDSLIHEPGDFFSYSAVT